MAREEAAGAVAVSLRAENAAQIACGGPVAARFFAIGRGTAFGGSLVINRE